MGQYRAQEKIINEQKIRIQELEHMVSLLEQENSLLNELAVHLKKENEMLNRYLEEYMDVMRRMTDDVCPEGDNSSCDKEGEIL